MLNKDINREIQRADFQGKTKEEIKPLYIERNAFGISVNSSVFRIFQSHFFLDDVANSEISLVNINPLVFGDNYENPLLDKDFIEEGGDTITLNGVVENYYGLSWTEEEQDESWRWNDFTHGKFGVRVKVSLIDLMNEINNIKNNFFMLNYFVGKVSYHKVKEIDEWVSESHYTHFLDSLGQLSALSLMALRKDFEDEKEIRLLFSYMPDGNEFVQNEVSVNNYICKHPFQWNSVVKEVLVDPRMAETAYLDYKKNLIKHGLTCEIKRSLVSL